MQLELRGTVDERVRLAEQRAIDAEQRAAAAEQTAFEAVLRATAADQTAAVASEQEDERVVQAIRVRRQ